MFILIIMKLVPFGTALALDYWTIPLDKEERHRLHVKQLTALTQSYSYEAHHILFMSVSATDEAIFIAPQLALLSLMHSSLHSLTTEAETWETWVSKFLVSGNNDGAQSAALLI